MTKLKLRTIFFVTLFTWMFCVIEVCVAQNHIKANGTQLVLKGVPQRLIGIRLADDVWVEEKELAPTLALLRQTGFDVMAIGVDPNNEKFVSPFIKEAEKQGLRVALQWRLSLWSDLEIKELIQRWDEEMQLLQSPVLVAWDFLSDDIERIQPLIDYIKDKDTTHLVGVVSDGLSNSLNETYEYEGCMSMLSDYFTLGLHPQKWLWTSGDRTYDALPNTYIKSSEYIESHKRLAEKHQKPLVISSADYPRDRNLIDAGTPTNYRLSFFQFLLAQMKDMESPLGLIYLGEYKQHYNPQSLPEDLKVYTYPQDSDFLQKLGESIKMLHN